MALKFLRKMIIQLNGQPHEISALLTVSELLTSIGYGGKPCVVELDEQAVFPRDFATTTVAAGAKVEVVTLAAGG
jgi:thiamine biosynthesis protein ThiS